MLIGNFQYTIDEKGRVKIPLEYSSILGTSLVLTLGIDNTIEIRSLKLFNEWLEKLLSKGSFLRDLRTIQRSILSNSFQVELDNQGRIRIPKELLKILDAKKVFLLGVGNKIEVISEKNWNKFMSEVGSKLLNEIVEQNYVKEGIDES